MSEDDVSRYEIIYLEEKVRVSFFWSDIICEHLGKTDDRLVVQIFFGLSSIS